MELQNNCRYIVEGVTEEGVRFRPSDWMDRIASMKAEFADRHRLVYSELLHPELYNGVRCLVLDTRLKEEDEGMYDYVLDFIKSNRLKMTYVCDVVNSQLGK